MTSTVRGDVRRRRLTARARKWFLVVHIVSVGAWIGIDVVMALAIFTAMLTDDEQTKALCLQALELFAVWPLLTAGLICLASGVVLSLGTKYGLVRYWWVAVKLVLNLLLTSLVLISLQWETVEAGEAGRRLAAGEPIAYSMADLIYPPIVSPAALVLAVVLAVFKPWGRVRKSPTSSAVTRERDG